MASDRFQTIVEALLAAPPERPFVTLWRDEDDAQTITFGEFICAAVAQAANFRVGGLQPGDRVILVMPQDIPLMVAFAGAMLAGAVPAILAYPNFKVDPAKYSSGLAGVSANLQARLVIVDQNFPDELLGCLSLAHGAELARDQFSFSSLSGKAPVFTDIACKAGDIAFIQHSAGTTGLQKGVALSHSSVLTQLRHLASSLRIDDADRIYSWLPLYHDMGLIACFIMPMVYHLPVVMQSPLDWVIRPATMLRLVSDYRCTLAWVPNFSLQFLARRVRSEDRVHFDLSSLRALINCSEPVRARSMDDFWDFYAPCNLKQDVLQSSYAMAENVFAVTQSELDRAPRRLYVDMKQLVEKQVATAAAESAHGSVCFVSSGRCLSGNQVRIVATNGADLPDGHVGEILIRSDSLFEGYYNRPDLTETAIRDGWYWSGDLGFSINGELFVIGRKKDLIITAGKNIYPQDIEELVSSHPAIRDGRVVAFGMYNSDLGTEDIIVVAETDSEENLRHADEIERAVRNAIVAELDVAPRAVYLRPPKWIVKSTAGKPARSTTREKLLTEQPELVGKGCEYLFEEVNDSIMTRTVQGKVNFWNRHAEELYGWSKEEAVGMVSHELLRTEFPTALEEIESELVQTGRWEGQLVHATRDGGHVVVESRWVLDPKREPAAVVEINAVRRFLSYVAPTVIPALLQG